MSVTTPSTPAAAVRADTPDVRARRPRAGLVALVLAAVFLALAIAARRVAPPRPNVLFILVDTLRADRVGSHDGRPSLTPFLDDVASHALVYDRAYAPSSWTMPSVASLFVGQRPFEHRLLDFPDRLPRNAGTLAEAFRSHDVDTAAIVATGTLSWGEYDRGFGKFRVVGHPSFSANPDGSEVNAAALDWLDHRDAARPFFLYLHYMEPHMPYRAHRGITARRNPALSIDVEDEPLSFRTAVGARQSDEERRAEVWRFTPLEVERLVQLYDGEVAYLDGVLRALFAALEARGTLERTVVVVTADHGEELGEHGLYSHAVSLYEPEIRVPLILRFPGDTPRGHVAAPVATAGLGATLLATMGIPAPPTFHVPALPTAPEASFAAPVISQFGPGESFGLREHRAALVEGSRKLLVTPAADVTVCDLAADPGEEHPDTGSANDRVRAAAGDMLPPAGEQAGSGRALPADAAERLRALGYLGDAPESAPAGK